MKDKQNCVLRVDTKSGIWTEYYLNKILPSQFTYFDREWGLYKIRFEGDEIIRCVYVPTDKHEPHSCYKSHTIDVRNRANLAMRFERAIDYVYANFCHYAQPLKPF